MSEILSQLITPQVKFVGMIILVFIGILYVLSIIWVVRDAYLRGTNPIIWGIIALIPFLGCMIYAMMRPPLYASDREEQNIGLLLQQRELMQYGECPSCGYPTTRDYVVCPNCHTRLRSTCEFCGKTLEPEWSVCPYCGESTDAVPPVASSSRRQEAPAQSRASLAEESQSTRRASSRGVVRSDRTQDVADQAPARSSAARSTSAPRRVVPARSSDMADTSSRAAQRPEKHTRAATASSRTPGARVSSGQPDANHAPEI